jgi:hypothetical protein
MAAAHKWAKGVSGNPSGLRKDGQPRRKRSKKPPGGPSRDELVSLARSYGPEMIERLLLWARSKNARMSVRATQLMIERAPLSRERFRCVLGMLSSLEVKVLRPT